MQLNYSLFYSLFGLYVDDYYGDSDRVLKMAMRMHLIMADPVKRAGKINEVYEGN